MWLMRNLGREGTGLISKWDIIGEKTLKAQLLLSWRYISISWTKTVNKKVSKSNHLCFEWDRRTWDSLLKEVGDRFISPTLATWKPWDWSDTSGWPLQSRRGRHLLCVIQLSQTRCLVGEMHLPLGVPNSLYWLSQRNKMSKKINAETVSGLQLAREAKLRVFNLMLHFCIRVGWITPWRLRCASELTKDRAKGKLMCCWTNFWTSGRRSDESFCKWFDDKFTDNAWWS